MHITDPHLFADPTGSLRGTVTHSSLRNVIDSILSANWSADFVAMTGDVIQDDSPAAYQRFRELLEPLSLPVLCVPGNHDIRDLMRDALSTSPFQYCGTLQRENWLIIGVDSCVRNSAAGYVTDQELHRLKKQIEDTEADHVLVCLHHPPLAMGSKWLDTVGLENGDEFLSSMSFSGKVRAAIFGHVHQAFDRLYDSMHIIGTPSTCRQFKPGSDEFDLDDNPPAYRKISLHADGSVESKLVWLPK